MKSGLSRVLCGLMLLGIAGCSFSDQIGDHALQYNKAVEDAHNAQIILNILRSRDHKPMHFTAVSQIRGSFTLTKTGNVSITIPFGAEATSVFPLTPSISVSQSSSPSFDVAVLNSKEFVSGLLSPVEVSLLKLYWDLGWPREVLLHLLLQQVTEIDRTTGEEKLHDNTPVHGATASFNGFRDWVRRAHREGNELSFGSMETVQQIGPPVDFTSNVGALVSVAESDTDLRITPIADTKLQQLCRVSTVTVLCQGGCPPNNTEEQCAQGAEPMFGVSSLLRSVHGAIYYLGQVLRYEEETGTPIMVRKGKELAPLFVLNTDPERNSIPSTRVKYGGKVYSVLDDESSDTTLTILALINQLLGLHKESDDLPTTGAVETVGQ